jgi:hypothetical protein
MDIYQAATFPFRRLAVRRKIDSAKDKIGHVAEMAMIMTTKAGSAKLTILWK